MKFWNRNNLDQATSPYLLQHKDNPIWWQEWSEDVLFESKDKNKIIFISVGYASCHWCHVMAQEAFQDAVIAEFLNKHFISVKVDREQRPDIDQYLMSFITVIGGQGGWPLNGFLTPDLKPFYALTYSPTVTDYGIPPFLEVLEKVKDYYLKKSKDITTFVPPIYETEEQKEDEIVESFLNAYDSEFGGFGTGLKFAQHSSLLFLLYYYSAKPDAKIKMMLHKTLDAIVWGGLHDQLQGGFFRYCVDREWTIPHFEKMIYDQAMLLWVYSVAAIVFNESRYELTVNKLLNCLEESFEENGLYYSSIDADVDHEEGTYYLWSGKELSDLLTSEELSQLEETYYISPEGNFEGLNHLVKKKEFYIDEIEKKLLKQRKTRKHPFIDKKIITSWNCLVGIGLIQAYRCLKDEKILAKSQTVFKNLMERHFREGELSHSSINGKPQGESFLQDYASLLLFATYLHEETHNYEDLISQISQKLSEFKSNGQWMESVNADFWEVPADSLDLSSPSSISVSIMALLRCQILLREKYSSFNYHEPLINDFLNISSLISHGLFHVIGSSEPVNWKTTPVNTMVVSKK